jgi:hypothetical protein
MNIFFLDYDVKKCAEYHNNRHCVKMILEHAQILCSVHWMNDNPAPYRLTHKNHPCSIWARESLSNYLYLCELTLELCREYTYRYGKSHKTQQVLNWCVDNKPNIQDIGLTTPALAMPDQYKTSCPVESYRNYYINEKNHIAEWKNRDIPYWFEEELVLTMD